MNSLRKQAEIELLIEGLEVSEEDKQSELDSTFSKKIKLIRKIVNILKELPGHDNHVHKEAALKLCQKHNLIDDACELFQLILDSPNLSLDYQKEIYEKYANYLIEWGFLEKAKVILSQKLRFAELSMQEQKNTANRIKEILSNYQSLSQTAMAKYQGWNRLPNDSELEQHLADIASKIVK